VELDPVAHEEVDVVERVGAVGVAGDEGLLPAVEVAIDLGGALLQGGAQTLDLPLLTAPGGIASSSSIRRRSSFSGSSKWDSEVCMTNGKVAKREEEVNAALTSLSQPAHPHPRERGVRR